jgi:RNA polymerase sigma factor (sigma-70 family)
MEILKIDSYPSSQLDDVDIVRRVIAGEKALFEILLRRHNQTLFRVIRNYLKDQEEVKDAMQNAYLKAYDKLFQFRGNSSFSTWLIRIGINEALLRLNDMKKSRTAYLNTADIADEMLKQIPDTQMNPERAIIRQESRLLFEQAIDHLPEKYRIVYILKEIEGFTNADVSEALDISDSNIKVRLHRAKSLLKESLYTLSVKDEVFEFGNSRCDAVVAFVMTRI